MQYVEGLTAGKTTGWKPEWPTFFFCMFVSSPELPDLSHKLRVRLDGSEDGSGPYYGENWDRRACRDQIGWDSRFNSPYVFSGTWVNQGPHGGRAIIHTGRAATIAAYVDNAQADPWYSGAIQAYFGTDLGTHVVRWECILYHDGPTNATTLRQQVNTLLDASFPDAPAIAARFGQNSPQLNQYMTSLVPKAGYHLHPTQHGSCVFNSYVYEKKAMTQYGLLQYDKFEGDRTKYCEFHRAVAANDGMVNNRYYSGFSSALQDAVEKLPQTQVNTAANLLDVAGLFTNLFGGVSNIPKTAKDAWLAYRYVYSTSKSDLEEYAQLTSRLTDLIGTKSLRSYGVFTDPPYIFRCELELEAESFLPKGFKNWLTTYGLKLSATNMWDMIPYSFVVDWFLGIGGMLEHIESAGRAIPYRQKACWYSVSTEYDGVNTYTRLQGGAFPVGYPRITFHQAGVKTMLKRFVDGVCLIGG